MTAAELCTKKCLPCEGGVAPLSPSAAAEYCRQLTGWTVTTDGKRIRKDWLVKNFDAAMAFFQRVATLSNAEGHHPDLHLVGFRNVTIEIWTHAIDGLSENDFILAAKIDELPVELKTPAPK